MSAITVENALNPPGREELKKILNDLEEFSWRLGRLDQYLYTSGLWKYVPARPFGKQEASKNTDSEPVPPLSMKNTDALFRRNRGTEYVSLLG